ncbi:hypothetical protein BJ546DRAFT_592190 [Cryomyces antarcticus]
MSGLEVVAVVACVAGVVSAFNDGSRIVRQIKDKRAARKAPPPTKFLEQSLDRAPKDIEAEKERGVERFGQAFMMSDHIAVIQLQQVTIDLQATLLRRLHEAHENDQLTDFTMVVDASDMGRAQTVRTLLDLYMRMAQSAPIVVMPQQQWPGSERSVPAASSMGRIEELPANESAASPKLEKKRTSSMSIFGGFGRSKRNGERSQSSECQSPYLPPPTPVVPVPIASRRLQLPLEMPGPSVYQVQSPVQHSPQASPDWQAADEEDLSQVWRTETQGTQGTQETQTTGPYGGMQRKPSVFTPQNSGLSLQTSPQSLLAPTADNNYLGFCKGAWKMQNGDKHAMKRLTEFNDGWSQSKVYYLACSSSKCAFAGRLPPEKANKVWISSSKGIRFRWTFLAKSHVPQKKVQEEQYVYQCMICAFQGRRSPNLAGTDTLLEHISRHRGEDLDKVVLYNTKCITGRIASDEEEFDINLEPLKDSEISRRDSFRPTSLVPDSDPRATSSSYGTPMPNEPWNEP